MLGTGCTRTARTARDTSEPARERIEVANQESSGLRIPNERIRADAAQTQADRVKRVVVSFYTTPLGASKDPAVIRAVLGGLRSSDREASIYNEPGLSSDELGRFEFEYLDGRTKTFGFHGDDLEGRWGMDLTRALNRIVPNLKAKYAKAESSE